MRKNKAGKVISVVIYNPITQKNERHSLARPMSEAEVKQYISAKKDEFKSFYKKRKESVHFISKYKRVDDLLTKFSKYRLKRGVSGSLNEISNLKNHTLKFFLDEINEPNILSWYAHKNEFMDWLDNRINSKNTLNNILRATNAFLTYFEDESLQRVLKFRLIEDHLIAKKDAEVLVSKKDFEKLVKFIELDKSLDDRYALVAKLQYHCGLRAKEALASTGEDLIYSRDNVLKNHIFNDLDNRDIDVYAVLEVSKQIDGNYVTDEFRPLKLKKEINAKNNRYVPIIDKKLAEELSAGFSFEGLSYQKYAEVFRKVFNGKTTSHHLRHTCISNFYILMGGALNQMFSKDVFGHSKQREIDRYTHIASKFQKRTKPKQIKKM